MSMQRDSLSPFEVAGVSEIGDAHLVAGTNEEQVSLRLSTEFLERVEALTEALSEKPEYRALKVTRAAVLRMAMEIGVDELEVQHGLKKKGRKR